MYRSQRPKPSQRGEKCKKAEWLSEKTLQKAEKRREVKGKGERERYIHLNSESKNSKER